MKPISQFAEYRISNIKQLVRVLISVPCGTAIYFDLCEDEDYPTRFVRKYANEDLFCLKIMRIFDDSDPVLCFCDSKGVHYASLSILLTTCAYDADDPAIADIYTRLCTWLDIHPSQLLLVKLEDAITADFDRILYADLEDPITVYLADFKRQTKTVVGVVDVNPIEAVEFACSFLKEHKADIGRDSQRFVLKDSEGYSIAELDLDFNFEISDYAEDMFLERTVSRMHNIVDGHRKALKTGGSAKNENRVSFYVDGRAGVLVIYLGDEFLTKVSGVSVCPSNNIQEYVQDILRELGYLWNKDGTVSKKTKITKEKSVWCTDIPREPD